MDNTANSIRGFGIILSAIALLTAAGCRAKRETSSTAEAAYSYQRISASSLSDSLSLIIDLELDSLEITLLGTPTTLSGLPQKAQVGRTAKAYGVQARLSSQRLTDADTATTESESATSEKASSNEVSAATDPFGKNLLMSALIIFSVIFIFIHIKRKKSAKNNYL